MVNYAAEADFVGHKKPRKYVSAAEAKRRRDARNAARSEEDWQHFAREAVYRLLGVRDRSTQELRTALQQRDVPSAIAEETIAAFVKAGLVDDAKFAAAFVRWRFAEKGSPRRRLLQELQKRGITGEDARNALAQIDDESETQAAVDFALRKVHSLRGLDREVARRRLYGALGRRGFSGAQIQAAMSAALEELSRYEASD